MTRALRTTPKTRRSQILGIALALSADIGHKNITRDKVAAVCGIASSTVAKYYRTMAILKRAVFKEAVRLEYIDVLQHCVSDEALDKFPKLKHKILKYISDRI